MSAEPPRRRFLTAEWRHLLLLNYEVEPSLLRPFVPAGTELDPWQGRTLLSLVGFLFRDTRILGIPIPWHRHFEEVNLRFYVRRGGDASWKRAVVFLRELVPKRLVASIARAVYNEPYLRVPMSHRIEPGDDLARPPAHVEYRWTHSGSVFSIEGDLRSTPHALERPSEAEFITEHYWGYTAQRNGATLEYEVAHPPWNVAAVEAPRFTGPGALMYGPRIGPVLEQAPRSAYYAAGSAITVYRGTLAV